MSEARFGGLWMAVGWSNSERREEETCSEKQYAHRAYIQASQFMNLEPVIWVCRWRRVVGREGGKDITDLGNVIYMQTRFMGHRLVILINLKISLLFSFSYLLEYRFLKYSR